MSQNNKVTWWEIVFFVTGASAGIVMGILIGQYVLQYVCK